MWSWLLGKIKNEEGVHEPTQGEGKQDDTWHTEQMIMSHVQKK